MTNQKNILARALLCGTILSASCAAEAMTPTDLQRLLGNLDLGALLDNADEIDFEGHMSQFVATIADHGDEIEALLNSPEGQEFAAQMVSSLQYLGLDTAALGISPELLASSTSDTQALQTVLHEIATNPAVANKFKESTASALTSVRETAAVPNDFVSTSILSAMTDISSVIGGRATAVGIASGDEAERGYGLWLKGMASTAKQKTTSKLLGYKASGQGFTIGGDIDLGDGTLGVAYSMIKSNASAKTTLTNKSKTTGHILSIYGSANVAENMTLDAQVRGGVAKIKTTHFNGSNTVSAKPKASLYGGNISLCYNYGIASNVSLVPSIGFAHDSVKVKSYKETGTGVKRSIGAVTSNKTSALLGLGVKYAADQIVSEVHGIVDLALKNKTSNTKITVSNNTGEISAGKMPKQLYKLGGSVGTSLSNVDLSLGYDLGLAKKYQAHSGYIKARVSL